MKRVSLLIVNAFILLLASCTKPEIGLDQSSPTATTSKTIEVVNGRLKFADHEAFFKTLKELSKVNLDQWTAQYEGFTSMNKTFHDFEASNIMDKADPVMLAKYKHIYRLNEVGGEKTLQKAVIGPYLSSLLNHEGLIQIGDNVMRMSDEKTLLVKEKDIAELDKPNSRLVTERLTENIPVISKNGRIEGNYNSDYEIDRYTPNGMAQRRICVQKYAISRFMGWSFNSQGNYGIEVGSIAYHQRSNWWGWGGTAADGWSRGSGSISTSYSPNGYYYPFPDLTLGASEVIGMVIFERYNGGGFYVQCNSGGITCTRNGGMGTKIISTFELSFNGQI